MKQKNLSRTAILILTCALAGAYLIHHAWAIVNNSELASATASQYLANAYGSVFICPEPYEAGGNWSAALRAFIDSVWFGLDTYSKFNCPAGSQQASLLRTNSNPPSSYTLTCSVDHDYAGDFLGAVSDADSYP